MVPPHDAGIIEEAGKIHSPEQIRLGSDFKEIGAELDAAYLSRLKELQLLPDLDGENLRIIYSNLHGTGIRLIPAALKQWGYSNVSLVEAQSTLDGNFSTVRSPNPEEEKALKMGTEQMIKEHADVFIATDPDADRVGAVALDGKNPVRLTGNQTALNDIATSPCY